MGSIFNRATVVIVWLGADEGSWLAIQELHAARRTRNHLPNIRDGLTSTSLWRRVWIHQEAMLANSVTIMGRGSTLPWEALNAQHALLRSDPYFDSM
jgi:hypothetical protein